MKKIYISTLLLFYLICGIFVSCKSNFGVNNDAPILSFDPKDSVLVDELVRFYIDSNIIPADALIVKPADGQLLTFDCVNENCEISNDFLQDSVGNTFFVEVMYAAGSDGNNNIYICQKDETGFKILFQMEGFINPDAGEEKVVNGYKVLYIQQNALVFELYFDGQQFTTKEIEPSAEELVTQN